MYPTDEHIVVIRHSSSFYSIIFEIPQASVLEPTLFLLNIHHLLLQPPDYFIARKTTLFFKPPSSHLGHIPILNWTVIGRECVLICQRIPKKSWRVEPKHWYSLTHLKLTLQYCLTKNHSCRSYVRTQAKLARSRDCIRVIHSQEIFYFEAKNFSFFGLTL